MRLHLLSTRWLALVAAVIFIGGLILSAGLIGGAISSGVSAKLAKNERKFRREMATTAYQYTMADMKKAGLNPMLAFSQGTSPVPAAGALPSVNIDTSKVAQTAMQVKRFGADLAAVEQGTATSAAQERKTTADAINVEATNPVKELIGDGSSAVINKLKEFIGAPVPPSTGFQANPRTPYSGPKFSGFSWKRFKNEMLYGQSTKPKKRTGASGKW